MFSLKSKTQIILNINCILPFKEFNDASASFQVLVAESKASLDLLRAASTSRRALLAN